MKLILASQSPRRAELLAHFGIPFEVSSADIDETRIEAETPIEMTERLSIEKANAILSQRAARLAAQSTVVSKASQARNCWVLAGDTTVALGNQVFGKPASRDEAISTLSRLSGQSHEVISSVCLMSCDHYWVESVISKVTFGELKPAWIEHYCDGDEPWDKAGSYGIQGAAGIFVERIDGDYSAIVGLPLWATGQLLARAGFR